MLLFIIAYVFIIKYPIIEIDILSSKGICLIIEF